MQKNVLPSEYLKIYKILFCHFIPSVMIIMYFYLLYVNDEMENRIMHYMQNPVFGYLFLIKAKPI